MPYKIIEEAWPEQFYISLETESETEVLKSNVESINLIETLGSLSPIMVLRFQDFMGDIVTTTTVYPDGVYNLNIGKTMEDLEQFSFSVSKNKFQNLNRSYLESIGCALYFISDKWPLLFKNKFNRGWKQQKISYIVNQIVSEIGFEGIDIEATEGKFNHIQPNWTNLQFIDWLSKQAFSTNGVAGYEYGATLNNNFFFKSFNELLNQEPKKEIILGQLFDEKSQEFSQATDLAIEQNYAEIMREGGGGYRYQYFDWFNKENISESLRISETSQRQLSDWYYIAESHEDAANFKMLSRDLNASRAIEHRITHLTTSIQKVEVKIEGDITIHIGDVVNLVIPSARFKTDPFNEFYSGYYLVSEVEHRLESLNKERKFDTVLKLTRQGVDNTDLQGFVESGKGKQLP